MNKRIITAGLAVLVAGSLAACSAPAASPITSTPAAAEAAVVTTPQPSASVTNVVTPQPSASAAAAPAVESPAPTRSPGPGSSKAEPGEDVFDFNIRQDFWATVQKDGATAGLYESDTYRTWRQQVGYHAPNDGMTTKCTLGARISETPERTAAASRLLHNKALKVPGVRIFAYPLICPKMTSTGLPRHFVIVAAVNPQLKVEELNYTSVGPDYLVFGVPEPKKL